MIVKLVITINFKSLYLRLVVVNAHWNSLDKGLQSSTSVKAFKSSLKTSTLNERDNL